MQERFQGLIPILSKWSGAIVGLTLIAIGVNGIHESLENKKKDAVDATTGLVDHHVYIETMSI